MAVRRLVQSGTQQQTQVSQSEGGRTVDVAAGRALDRNRRSNRSQDLISAVQRLDTTSDAATSQAIMQWIEEEYEGRQGGQLVGLFSRCYLGEPYVDHRLDLSGGHILEHFTRGETPPGPFNMARPFARSNAYVFIEVYDDGTVIPVRADGRPVI